MFWVIKISVSMRRFFRAPILVVKEISAILHPKFLPGISIKFVTLNLFRHSTLLHANYIKRIVHVNMKKGDN